MRGQKILGHKIDWEVDRERRVEKWSRLHNHKVDVKSGTRKWSEK